MYQNSFFRCLIKRQCLFQNFSKFNTNPTPQLKSPRFFIQFQPRRTFTDPPRIAKNDLKSKRSTLYYLCAVGVLVAGASYAAVPLYRIFCKSYSYGGTVGIAEDDLDLSKMKKIQNRPIKIKFNADRSSALLWNFRPEQLDIIVNPGETALAFYRAENKTDRPVDGISTYNVLPFEAGQYFNKIQCFCFEEQRLNPGELVELPVFFYIDPEFVDDPKMEYVNEITLSYTFFEAKEVPNLNIPWLSHGKSSSGVPVAPKGQESPKQLLKA